MNILATPQLGLVRLGKIKNRKSSEIRNSIFSIGFECLDRELFNPDKCYDRAAELGVKWARCQTAWNRCERTKGNYTFDWLDEVVNQLLKRGIQPWLSIVYGNQLYMNDIPHPSAVGCIPTEFGLECQTAWLNYLNALVIHFHDRVQWWEIWNEPNLKAFWYPGTPGGSKYAEVVKLASEAIRAVDANAKIIACVNSMKGEFILDAITAGAGKHIDAFSIHPYGFLPEEAFSWRINHLRALLAQNHSAAAIWQGECGYPAIPYGHKDDEWLRLYNASETTQAKYVLRRMLTDMQNELGMSSYFHIADLVEGVYRTSDGREMRATMLGLLKTRDYLPRQAFQSMRNMTSLFDDSCRVQPLELEVWFENYSLSQLGALPILGIQRAAFLRQGFPLYVWYLAEDLQREWFGVTDAAISILNEAERPITHPALYDPMAGDVYKITSGQLEDNKIWRFARMPMTDYPLILTDREALELE